METSVVNLDEIVNKIVFQTFGVHPINIEEIKGKGKNNRVFKIELGNKAVILRMNNTAEALELYKKEKWCAEVAGKTNVPTPAILNIGKQDEYAFSFQEFIEGIRGTDNLDELGKIWLTLGKYANLINQIQAPDFSINYKDTIKNLFADDFFIVRNIFSKEVSNKIQSRLEETLKWELESYKLDIEIWKTRSFMERKIDRSHE